MAIEAKNTGFSKKSKSFEIYRPNTGRAAANWYLDELNGKGRLVHDRARAKTLWQVMYERTASKCLHQYLYGTCRTYDCNHGTHKREDFVLRSLSPNSFSSDALLSLNGPLFSL